MERSKQLVTLLHEMRADDPASVRAFVVAITPVMQVRIAKVLLRRADGRSVRRDVEDLVQETLVTLFANDAKVLRRWDPELGHSLEGYVGMIAERRALSKLRTKKGNPYAEDPTEPSEMPSTSQPAVAERRLVTKQTLASLMSALRAQLSPQAMRVFELLWIEEASTARVQEELGMTRDAVYAAKLRIKKTAAAIARDLREAEERREVRS